MSMMDYGSIVFKNGKRVTEAWFTPMKKAVGWEDNESIKYRNSSGGQPIKNICWNFVGDKEATIGFYKEGVIFIESFEDDEDKVFYREDRYFNNEYTWYKWETEIGGGKCIVKHRNGYYVMKWNYKGDKYKIYFGRGVDVLYYKKWHIVNYYRSPDYFFRSLKNKIKDKI